MTALTVQPLTPLEARELTDRIRGAAVQLHDLLLEAYARGAWSALGYTSWREYATQELSISQSRAYRLLDQASVIAAIAEASGSEISQVGKISALAASEIKDVLPDVTAAIQEKVAAGAEPTEAVREAVTEAREAKRDERFSAAVHDAPPEDDESDIVHTLEEQERRIAELEADKESLQRAIDVGPAEELKRQRVMYAQLEGRLLQEITSHTAALEQAKYLSNLLKRIRDELGVAQNQQIMPAVRTLMAGRGVA